MYKKVYKINALNNSFSLMLNELIIHLRSEHDIDNIVFSNSSNSFLPDNLQIGNPPYEPWHKPEYIFITLNFCEEKSWTNDGGHSYCECYLKDKSKILINWDTSSDSKKIEKFSIKFIRKLKLDKLNLIYTEK